MAVALAAVAVALTVPSTAAANTAAACPGYGNGESLANWNRSGFNASPPAGWQIIQVPYHAGVFPVVDRLTLDASVAEGTAKLDRAVGDFHAASPGARLVLAGLVPRPVLDHLAATSPWFELIQAA
ncbi:hypothetical protein [Actinophytocola glycyrrhizae]|uniref:Uncharacterized protein n=1 Tax=Actinophytocola glycyrrhizae TaxID=2044873 RepID=A0ABV9S900_9PSEU